MALVITKVTPQGLFPMTELLYCNYYCHSNDRAVAKLATKATRPATLEDTRGGKCAGCNRRFE